MLAGLTEVQASGLLVRGQDLTNMAPKILSLPTATLQLPHSPLQPSSAAALAADEAACKKFLANATSVALCIA